jgi:2-methylcitrate dehydratase PrpD
LESRDNDFGDLGMMVTRSPEPLNSLNYGDLAKAAQFLCALKLKDLDKDVIEKAKLCILDVLGSMLAGSLTKAGRIARSFSSRGLQSPEATVIGGDAKVSLQNAAFANAVMGSAYDIDDGHRRAAGHPGATIISAALAVAEKSGCSGEELIESLVGGYEIALRIGESLYLATRQVYGSGRWASVGAAAACCKLLGLDEQLTSSALGIANTFSPVVPPKVLKESESWPMTKEGAGWGAMVGLSAALLSQQGFVGPTLARDLSHELLVTLGKAYEIRNVYFKPYPSCRWTHCAIEAALELKQHYNFRSSQIKSVKVSTFRRALALSFTRPSTIESAQFSIPFTVGAALAVGRMSIDEVAEEQLDNSEILNIAGKVTLEHNEGYDKLFPEAIPAEVTIGLVNGDTFTKRKDVPKGNPRRPMSRSEMLEKFRMLASRFPLSTNTIETIVSTVTELENCKDVSALLGYVR